ncbi:MAG TPA: OmpA family protein [Bacteroidia bacterium]|jgi:outer membrane protein OmpA-like peptidoglycan-associated protein|nr:OmpA family protein [Bacteroidia bacterium]
MRRIVLSFLLIIVSAASLSAQSRRQWLEFGDKAYADQNYKLALACYQHVITMGDGADRDLVTPYECRPYVNAKKVVDSTALKAAAADTVLVNPNLVKGNDERTRYVVRKVADCYRLTHDYDNSELWYRQAIFLPDNRFPDTRFWYGVALMNNAKYAAAADQFDKYSEPLDASSKEYIRAQKFYVGCLFAMDTSSVKKEVILTKLDSSINAGTAVFAATYFGDPNSLIFTAGKSGNVSTPDITKLGLDAYTTDIYTAQLDNGHWQNIKPLQGSVTAINSSMNEGAAMVSFGKETVFFTRWSEDGKECAIYMSKNVNDSWLAPKRLDANVNMPGCRNMMPFFSNDGSTLYFVSDRDGGKGGLDIWSTQLDEDGNASPAVNMGSVINTADDEITPFYHFTSSTLFYSSNGMGGFGGFDVVKSSFNADDSTWSTPKNLEAPFNSSRDDAYFVLDRLQQTGYLSSDREPCSACGPGSAYCYRAYSFANEPLVFSISGYVYDKETGKPIEGALLTFKDIRGNVDPSFVISDSTGYYYADLQLGEELYIKAQKNKYFGDATNLSTVGLTDSKHFDHDFYLTPITGADIVIPGIEYDYDKATLRPESKAVLDDLVAFLELNDNISVEISAHTDSRGSDSYNMSLSQRRAQSVVDYLISKGISKDRLQAQGYGETKPLIPDKEILAMPNKADQEAAYQKNRRTAFRPIKEGVIRDKWEGKIPENSHLRAPANNGNGSGGGTTGTGGGN